jgi:hypothetical protein
MLSNVVLISSLVVNMIAVLGVAFYGGRVLGRVAKALETMEAEVSSLRQSRHDQQQSLTALSTNVDWICRRLEDNGAGRKP